MSKPRPLLFVIESLTVGGAERIVVDLANTLDRTLWQPHVACLAAPGPLAQELAHDVPHYSLGKKTGIDTRLPKRLRTLVANISPAIVNSHLWTANTWARFALRKSGIPVIATEHNRDSWKRWHHRMIDRWLARYTAALVAVSDDAAAFYQEDVGIPAQLIHTIPNGIRADYYATGNGTRIRQELALPSDTPLVGTVGRLTPQKNMMRLLESVAHARRDIPELHCLIAGDGLERTRLKLRAAQENLSGSVHFLGTRHDVPDILAALDLFILSSDREGHPLTALEAQAAGVPVLLTDVGGCRHAIATCGDETGGVLVPPEANALTEAMVVLLQNPKGLKHMGAFAGTFAREHFDLTAMVQAYDALFQKYAVRTIS